MLDREVRIARDIEAKLGVLRRLAKRDGRRAKKHRGSCAAREGHAVREIRHSSPICCRQLATERSHRQGMRQELRLVLDTAGAAVAHCLE